MQFVTPHIPAILLKRYKRFLADVELSNGEVVTVHTPNTGSMLGVAEPGMQIWLRDVGTAGGRKYRYSWEMSEPMAGVFVGVHTGIVNALVSEAIENGTISELQGYSSLEQEMRYGHENSRIDLLLRDGESCCYIEIKNVTARDKDGLAIFPDAVSLRGQKHLRELMRVVDAGHRAVMFYCIQRTDTSDFRPAVEIDAEYARLLRTAVQSGVEVLAYQADVHPNYIRLTQSVAVRI